MPKKQVSRQDLKELVELARLMLKAEQKYLDRGFTLQTMMKTFTAIYWAENARILRARGKSVSKSLGDKCLVISGSFIGVVTQMLHLEQKREKRQQDKKELARVKKELGE